MKETLFLSGYMFVFMEENFFYIQDFDNKQVAHKNDRVSYNYMTP